MTDILKRERRAMKQPRKDALREQLAMAADTIIDQRERWEINWPWLQRTAMNVAMGGGICGYVLGAFMGWLIWGAP